MTKNPNLLGIERIDKRDFDLLIHMKFSAGGDLQKFYNRNILVIPDFIVPENIILFWAHQLVSAIGYLHKNNIVHRDIKMANILLDIDGNLKLCDFGLCKLLDEPG